MLDIKQTTEIILNKSDVAIVFSAPRCVVIHLNDDAKNGNKSAHYYHALRCICFLGEESIVLRVARLLASLHVKIKYHA